MTSLDISLVLLAGFAIAAVFGYNIWNSRARDGKKARSARVESQSRDRAEDRGEPTLELDSHGHGRTDDPDDPSHTLGADTDVVEPVVPGGRGSSPALNPIADCIVELKLSSPLSGERVIQLTRKLRRAGSKPMIVEAAAIDTDATHPWEAPAAGRQYESIRVGVLLANRHGPLNAMEFSEFVAAVQSLADHLSVLADTPDMAAVLARARDLDEVCASLDAQVGLGIEAPEVLGVADLVRLAAECGCVERGNNRHARLGPAGEVLFSLALTDTPNRMQLLLDVPRAPAGLNPWRELVECAQRCAKRLDGPLVDDAGRPLPETQLERIGQQIAQRHASLESAGFPAGSALALRLFN